MRISKKNVILIATMVVSFFLQSLFSQACEFNITRKSESEKVENLKGYEDIIIVEVTKNHRRCDYDFRNMKFNGVGLTITGATPWKKKNGRTFVRKLKVVYENNDLGELQMRRNCDEGLQVESYKISCCND